MENANKEESSLESKLAVYRERFRLTLARWWGQSEVIPHCHQYYFDEAGSSTPFQFSGLAGNETRARWRSVGDRCIEFTVADDAENSGWERIEYDFVVALVGFESDVVLCEASMAERYRKKPKNFDLSQLGFNFDDGSLIRIAD